MKSGEGGVTSKCFKEIYCRLFFRYITESYTKKNDVENLFDSDNVIRKIFL